MLRIVKSGQFRSWLLILTLLVAVLMTALFMWKPVEAGWGGITWLAVDVSPASGGYVNLEGVRLPSYPAYEPLRPETEVTLEAVPALGYRFSSWRGDINNVSKIVVIKAGSDQMITANFSRLIPHWLIATIATVTAIAVILGWRRRRREHVAPDIPVD